MLLAVIVVSASAGTVPASLTQLRTGADADSQMLTKADRSFLGSWHAAQERNRASHRAWRDRAWRDPAEPIGKTWVIRKKAKAGTRKSRRSPEESQLKDKLHDLANVVKETRKQGHEMAAVDREQSKGLRQWKQSKWRALKGEMLAEASDEHREGWERAEEASHEMQAWQRAGEKEIKREEADLDKKMPSKGIGKYPPRGASLVESGGPNPAYGLDENGVPDPRSPDFDPLGGVLDSLDSMQAHFEELERHSPVHQMRIWAQEQQDRSIAAGGGVYQRQHHRPRRPRASHKAAAALSRMVRQARRKAAKATSFLEEEGLGRYRRHSRYHEAMDSFLSEHGGPREGGNPYLAEMYGQKEAPRPEAPDPEGSPKEMAKAAFHREAQAFHRFQHQMAEHRAEEQATYAQHQQSWKKVYHDAHLETPPWLDAPLPVHNRRLTARPILPREKN